MVMGLVRQDSGSISLFGKDVPDSLPEVIGRVGAVVEQPKFVPSFSGRDNLSLLARAVGCPEASVDAALEQTRMLESAAERYSTYSLGMKQRLGIAAVLLKKADLVIFDEPTNGLDPVGIREIRQTMKEMAANGRTVLVSSHILAEIQALASSVSILNRGSVVAAGPISEVLGTGGQPSLHIRVSDTGAAVRVLQERGFDVQLSSGGQGGVTIHAVDDATTAIVARELARHEIEVHELSTVRPTLEDVFLRITGEASVA
jgi:ABC-type multidrug transport system ATPase subunit